MRMADRTRVAIYLSVALVLVSSLAALSIHAIHAQLSETGPTFKLGFKALADQIPSVVGQPLEDEHYGANGDSLQQTTTGLMVWRKADNWTAFTNGNHTWINGPYGVQDRDNNDRFDWEHDQPANAAPPESPPAVTSGSITLSPRAIPLSDPDIAGNSGRGAYRWSERAPEPAGWPAADGYMRWSWREFEPTEGNYQWNLIDGQLAAAAARGGRFGFRIMPANSLAGGTSIPDYLMAQMPLGFWFNSPANGKNMYAPDWNSSAYMDRAEAMIRAVAARYANDPRLGWVEIGPYGDYGEWHVWRWPYPSSTGAQDMTLANRQRLIDLHVELFPADKLIQMVDSADWAPTTLSYALSKSPLIGVRSDCLGDNLFDMRMGQVARAGFGDRWKTAPVIVEYCGGWSGSGQYSRGLSQITSGHVSLVEGNHASYSRLSGSEQSDFDTTRKMAGYRIRIASLTLPGSVNAGSSFSVTAQWANDGVAPTYDDWNVVLRLRDAQSGTVAWSGASSLNLRTLLPTGDSPLLVSDSFTLPASTPSGGYSLEVTVQDVGTYLPPLALANGGRNEDGSYTLGRVTVK